MKNWLLPLAIVAVLIAIYEQSKERPSVYIMCAAVVVFMMGVINLSSKIKSKNDKNSDDDTE
ncbi:MAG: hypothetical protein EOO50_04805 [Flavobacterium sp.]|uniref:hypothetical protein n=1 Tax=Flavobacterium sp. TaxID=239 RepID=UPI0012066CB1|nr:hypothetical protein [Flavobacterium sp.]RZJ67602.1 MAG: hypothetical protein EOO50_04805 [Flavobacterium sp.]